MSDELRSLPSLSSIGFGSPQPVDEKEDTETARLKKDFPRNVNFWRFATLKEVTYLSYHAKKDLLDYYQIGLICNTHNRIAIQLIDEQMCSLPFIAMPVGGCQKAMFLYQILDKAIPKSQRKEAMLSSRPRIESILQIEDPRTGTFAQRRTVYHWISSKKCCQHSDTIFWVGLDELKNGMEIDALEHSSIVMRDDQAYNLLNMVLNGQIVHEPIVEMDTDSMLNFITDEASPIRKFIEIGNFNEKVLNYILHEFICHCWPSTVMSFPLFCQFISKLSPNLYRQYLTLETAKRIFYAICVKSRYVVDFSEFVIGLLMMDETICVTAKNGGIFTAIQELRLRLQFRYYDLNRKGYLTYENILLLVKEFVDEVDTKNRLKIIQNDEGRKQLLQDWIKTHSRERISFAEFKEFIMIELPKRIEKISKDVPDVFTSIVRVKFDLAGQVNRLFDYSQFTTQQNKKSKSKYSFYKPLIRKCDSCRTSFRFSDSKLQLNLLGKIIAIYRLTWTQTQPTDYKTVLSSDLPDSRVHRIAIDVLIRIKTYAENLFKKNIIQEDEILSRWNYPRKSDQLRAIEMIIYHSKEIFSRERRVVPVNGPTFVFGDIHGNLRDLIHFCNSNLIGKLPFLTPTKCVFLGDYVDRGDWSVEVIVLLFCLKILAPESVYLVRGNHELRSVQHEFGFMIECKTKIGLEYWRHFNDVFDVLPVAALIDDRIYGAHGGIPTSGNTLEQLRRAPLPLSNPSVECHEAWEAMWNDPLNEKDVGSLRNTDVDMIKKTGGFVLNPYRGTGFRFLTEAVRKFIKRNDLDYIIRAHEVQMPGFMFYNQGFTISVFSTSNYIGSVNSAGVILLSDNKIRCIQVERTYKPEVFDAKT